VQKGSPSLSFDLSGVSNVYGDAAFSVAGHVTTNSGGTQSFALGAGSHGCSVSSAGLVTITGAAVGSEFCVISVSVAESANYLAAGPLSSQFHIDRKQLTVTGPSPAAITFGDSLPSFVPQITGWVGSDSVAGLTTAPTCGLDPAYHGAGSYAVKCSGGVDDNYSFAYVDGSFTANKAAPNFTFDLSGLTAKTFNDPAFSVASYAASSNSSGAISFALGSGSHGCSVTSAGQVTITGAAVGTDYCIIEASLAESANYLAAGPISQQFHIAKADQTTLTVTSPNSGINGDKLTPAATGGSGTGALTFTAIGSACEMGTGADAGKLIITSGTGTCSITAHKAADANYNAADSAPYAVTIARVSFLAPVDGAPIVNIAKLGRIVPVKANVFVNGTAVGATGGPIYVGGLSQVACATGEAIDAIDQYAAAGTSNSGNLFRWDSTGQFWIYNFDTSAFSMKQGNCYRINVYFGGVVSGGNGSGGALAGYFLMQTTR